MSFINERNKALSEKFLKYYNNGKAAGVQEGIARGKAQQACHIMLVLIDRGVPEETAKNIAFDSLKSDEISFVVDELERYMYKHLIANGVSEEDAKAVAYGDLTDEQAKDIIHKMSLE